MRSLFSRTGVSGSRRSAPFTRTFPVRTICAACALEQNPSFDRALASPTFLGAASVGRRWPERRNQPLAGAAGGAGLTAPNLAASQARRSEESRVEKEIG